jgi:hypothetical protein
MLPKTYYPDHPKPMLYDIYNDVSFRIIFLLFLALTRTSITAEAASVVLQGIWRTTG